jgi:hypothetical protein
MEDATAGREEKKTRGVCVTVLDGLACLERTLPPGEQYPGDGGVYGDPLAAARAWLAHAEVFLAWVADHPELVGIHFDARRLLSELRGG